jgi:hypothetical protein
LIIQLDRLDTREHPGSIDRSTAYASNADATRAEANVAKQMTPENIGAALGRLANRIDAWKKQRDELVAEAERLAGVALGYVRELRGQSGAGASAPPGVGRKGRGGRPRGMKMSEETKAKLRAAWKRRKARMAQVTSTAGEPPKARKRRSQ